MDFLFSLLRFLHILSAIFWVGTTLFMVFFLDPAIRAAGPDGGKVMQKLIGGSRFSLVIPASGLVVVLTGLFMYGPATANSVAIMLGQRLPLTLGSIAGIASAVVGTMFQGQGSAGLKALGAEMAAQSGPPTPAQLSEMKTLQTRIRVGGKYSAALMVIAVVGMTW